MRDRRLLKLSTITVSIGLCILLLYLACRSWMDPKAEEIRMIDNPYAMAQNVLIGADRTFEVIERRCQNFRYSEGYCYGKDAQPQR